MSNLWLVIAVVVLAAGGIVLLRNRGLGANASTRGRSAGAGADSNFSQDREDNRVARMSDEDRAWEAASLKKNEETRERIDIPVEQPV